ncbi:MAG: MFS transporter [Chlamydiia bacterium]|nr:MFS transporter [Chlamydiia bacterium]
MSHQVKTIKWIIWCLAVAFYFYEFIARVLPSVMIEQLMIALVATAETIGFVSGIYFYAYSPMQIPVGVLFDRFGPRKILIFASLVCGFGVLFFGLSTHVWEAAIGRLFTGLGSAFAFVGMVYITSQWFRGERLALLIGIANAIAMIGAAGGEGPISVVEEVIGWRTTVISLGIIGFILAYLFYWILKKAPHGLHEHTKTVPSFIESFKSFKCVVKDRFIWINGIGSLFFYATTSGFAALWGVSFLQHTHQMNRNQASFANSMIYIGWLVGGPLIGYFSDLVKKRKPFLLIFSFLGFLVMVPLIYVPHLSKSIVIFLLFGIGFFSSAQLLNFSFAIERHKAEETGSAVAFTNFLVTLGGAIFQPLVGFLLDLSWTGTVKDDIREYSFSDFQMAVTIFPLSFLLSFAFTLFLKEEIEVV